MSRIVQICFRDKSNKSKSNWVDNAFQIINQRINMFESEKPIKVLNSGDGVFVCCINPSSTISIFGCSVYAGYISSKDTEWYQTNSVSPEGSYSIFRVDSDSIELVSDAMGSRTIWYYINDEIFISSTSQRALIILLKKFEFNDNIIPWMLTNGIMGPGLGWDKRFGRVQPNEVVVINRSSWSISKKKYNQKKLQKKISAKEARNLFNSKVKDIILNLEVDPNRCILPLSEGYDSRLLAFYLSQNKKLQTVTWGADPDIDSSKSEGKGAKKIADLLRLPHKYYSVSQSKLGIKSILNRFVSMSEGRTDNILSYIDGFNFWEGLNKQGVEYIIRGDEAFGGCGWTPVKDEREVRIGLGLAYPSDFSSTAWLKDYGFSIDSLPNYLERCKNESLYDWRHRLYCEFRVPVAIAALTETESAYVDAIKPLQFKSLVELIHLIPTSLRNDKKILIDHVCELIPNIPYGTAREGDQMLDFLKRKESVSEIRECLLSEYAKSIIPNDILMRMINELPSFRTGESEIQKSILQKSNYWLRANLPRWVKRRIKNYIPDAKIDPCLFAFRAFIIIKTNEIMTDDALALSKNFNELSQ